METRNQIKGMQMARLSEAVLSKPGMSREEKFQTMQLRRAAFIGIAKNALHSAGYVLGESLKIPGGHAFRATHKGRSVKVGLKTSADRWVGAARDKDGTFGILSKVDEVFVVAFDSWHEPKRVHVYKLEPDAIISVAEKVYADADKQGETGLRWFPLDANNGQWPAKAQHGAHLASHAELIFDEAIIWGDGTDEPMPPRSSAPAAQSEETPIMVRIKTMLSEHMGVRPELIEIDVRVKI